MSVSENVKNEIVLRLKKETKFSLHYILKALSHKAWFYTYEESYTKKELFEACENLVEESPELFKRLNSYLTCFNV